MKKSATANLLRLAVLLVIMTAVLAAPAYLIYRNALETIIQELGRNAVNIAATVSELTEANIDKYLKIPTSNYALYDENGGTGPEDAYREGAGLSGANNGPNRDGFIFYEELSGIFSRLIETTGAQNIYIEKRISETQKAYLFKKDFEPRPRYYTAVLLSDAEVSVYRNGIAGSSGLLKDKDVGAYISGFAPIKDSGNNVVGIVAVEFALKYAEGLSNGIRIIIAFSFAAVAILGAVIVELLIKSRQKYYKKDYLTELCNKRYFENRLRFAIRSARLTSRPLALIMIDIDNFKNLNDAYGHQTGDIVLKSVSETLLKLTRGGDICAHYGGDEFAVLLTDTDKTLAAFVAERIRNEAEYLRFTSGETDIAFTLSIGVASLEHDTTAEELVHLADQAMYESKKFGRNKVTAQN